MKTLAMLALAPLPTLATARVHLPLSCLNPAGAPVDWWSGIKLGVSGAGNGVDISDPGHAMAYFDSTASDSWQWDTVPAQTADAPSGSIYHTTMQLPYMSVSGDETTTGYIVYNDQWCQCPVGRTCTTKVLDDGSVCPTYDPIYLTESPDERGCHW